MTYSRVVSPARRAAGRVLHVLGPIFYPAILLLSPFRLRTAKELMGDWSDSARSWRIAFRRDHAVVEGLYDVVKSGTCKTNTSARTVTIDIESLKTTYRYKVVGNTLSLTQSLSGTVNTFSR